MISELERMQISSVRNHIALISNRWKELQQQRILDTISRTDYELGRNKINSDLLGLLDLVERGEFTPNSPKVNTNSRRIIVPALLAIGMLVIGWFAWLKIGLNSNDIYNKSSLDKEYPKQRAADRHSDEQPEESVDRASLTPTYKAKTLELETSQGSQNAEPIKGNNGLEESGSRKTKPVFKDYQEALKYASSLESKDDALECLKDAIKLTASNQEKGYAYYCLAMFYYNKLKDQDEAIEWLEEAYNIDPIPKYKKKIESIRLVQHME